MGLHYPFFKAYDVRGRVPDELNEDIAWRIGQAYAEVFKPKNVIVGRDMRLSSPALCKALMNGLADAGVDVIDIGMCGTEEVYFATFHYGAGGGIMVTASHNPANYNGMKFVREGAKPVSGDDGLPEIEALVARGEFSKADTPGQIETRATRDDYIDYLLRSVPIDNDRPLKIVTNAGNGMAGPLMDALEDHLPYEFIKIQNEPDGEFPNGVPNPLLPENRTTTIDTLRQCDADMAIAWDGDFDRCFFFDENGRFIEGYYIVGLLAEILLQDRPGQNVVHDPRLYWNTEEQVAACGGRAIKSKTGHAFIKATMREHDALYGGEMSAHHYFRDFAYCDNGTLPWLLLAAYMAKTGQSLSSMVDERMSRYPASGEINRTLADADGALNAIVAGYADGALEVETVDGIGITYEDWRFNLRKSNTEPVVRLNVEARGNSSLMDDRTAELLEQLELFAK